MRMSVLVFALAFAAGCKDKNGRVLPPAYNGSAGAEACAAYDTDKDGAIRGPELDRVPGIRAAIKQVDSNGDGRVTAEEIDGRVAKWLEVRIGEMPVRCRVMLDGTPLPDATVVFEPEPFLGTNVPSASGTTSSTGIAGMTMPADRLADAKFPGVACGWYKIRVTSKNKELPAKYNTQTTLGCEVAMDAHWMGDGEILIDLKSPGN
jgi:hypothetical protein